MPPSFGVWEKDFFLSASAVLLRKKLLQKELPSDGYLQFSIWVSKKHLICTTASLLPGRFCQALGPKLSEGLGFGVRVSCFLTIQLPIKEVPAAFLQCN
jgi:hypothetical protein